MSTKAQRDRALAEIEAAGRRHHAEGIPRASNPCLTAAANNGARKPETRPSVLAWWRGWDAADAAATRTNITELAGMFPDGPAVIERPTLLRLAPLQPGETIEQAHRRQVARTERIRAQIAARRSA